MEVIVLVTIYDTLGVCVCVCVCVCVWGGWGWGLSFQILSEATVKYNILVSFFL